MTIQQASQELVQNLSTVYNNREAANIADWVMEYFTGLKKSERVMNRDAELHPDKISTLNRYITELLTHKPVQYVLHEAWFCGLKFYVDENVLIPRPETEELVDWIARSRYPKLMNKLLDVGTGSGCIPIAIRKKTSAIWPYACDVSKKALDIAERNARAHEVTMTPVHLDFLDKKAREVLPKFEVIVSNPPYIPLKDKESMSPNVVNFEPHLALFVQDNDPFIFYRAIAEFAQTNLSPGGAVFVEIHEELAAGVQEIFNTYGFTHIEVKKDMQGKERMIRAAKP
jgi:release factor glutamine methyltransferase